MTSSAGVVKRAGRAGKRVIPGNWVKQSKAVLRAYTTLGVMAGQAMKRTASGIEYVGGGGGDVRGASRGSGLDVTHSVPGSNLKSSGCHSEGRHDGDTSIPSCRRCHILVFEIT